MKAKKRSSRKDRKRDRQLDRIGRRRYRRRADTEVITGVDPSELPPDSAGGYFPYEDVIKISKDFDDPSVLIHERYHDDQNTALARMLGLNRAQDPAIRKAFRKAKRAYKRSDSFPEEGTPQQKTTDYMLGLGDRRSGVGRGGQDEFEAILKGTIDYARDQGIDLASENIDEVISKLDNLKGQNPRLLRMYLEGASDRGSDKEIDALMSAFNARYTRRPQPKGPKFSNPRFL